MRGHWEKGHYIIGNHKAASWSKWGGKREGYQREDLEEWNCQSCGKKQLKDFPEYLLLLDDITREYIRTCTECRFRTLMSGSISFTKLQIEIQTRDIREYVATITKLMTLTSIST